MRGIPIEVLSILNERSRAVCAAMLGILQGDDRVIGSVRVIFTALCSETKTMNWKFSG